MTPIPRSSDFATAEAYIAADARWMQEQGAEANEHRAEIARAHWENSRNATLRRAGIRIPGDRSRMTHGRYL